MTNSVKEFIEDNIDDIEKQDWETVFKNWYTDGDDYYFDDLIQTFRQANIDVFEEAKAARANVLQSESKIIFSNLSQMFNMITFYMVYEELNSLLGFERQEFVKVLTPSARAVGLVRCSEGWKRT